MVMTNRKNKRMSAWAVFTPAGSLVDGSTHHTKKACLFWVAQAFGVAWKRVEMRGFKMHLVDVEVRD